MGEMLILIFPKATTAVCRIHELDPNHGNIAGGRTAAIGRFIGVAPYERLKFQGFSEQLITPHNVTETCADFKFPPHAPGTVYITGLYLA